MHFDFLIEDSSGKKMLKLLLPKILENNDTYTIHSYNGVGHIPKNLKSELDPKKRVLLNQLPRLIRGFGNTHKGYDTNFSAILIIIVDLDNKNKRDFLDELNTVLASCTIKPKTKFCLAIEEGEAWFLGDLDAIYRAYPLAKKTILSRYIPDSICGTWEILADGIYPGGSKKLKSKGTASIGKEKSCWAENITPEMNIGNNASSSFRYFLEILKN